MERTSNPACRPAPEGCLGAVRPAAKAVVEAMREPAPEEMDIESGVKLARNAGAVIVRNSAEAHLLPGMSGSAAPDTPPKED
jgi:hypothetical protein